MAKNVADELDRLVDMLASRLTRSDEPRPRPDLHAETDRRLTILEKDMTRILAIVEDIKKVVESQAEIDRRVAEIEAGRREDRAAAAARQESFANRGDNLKFAIMAVPSIVMLCVLVVVVGIQFLPPG